MSDLNALMLVYLQALYSSTSGDLTSLVRRYLDAEGGDATVALRKLMAAATEPGP